ncbi:MAG: VOC family protein [Pseudomonadota bacterium]
MNRLFCNILTDDVDGLAGFYEAVFGMTRHFDSDWFVILVHADMPGQEFGILKKDADIVPGEARTAFGGAMITFVVGDSAATYDKALAAGARSIEAPKMMPYGQQRALVRDPAGTLIDISAPV